MEEEEGERELCHPFGLHALPNVGLVTPGYVAGFHLEFDKGKKEDIKPGELGKVRGSRPPFLLPRRGGRGGTPLLRLRFAWSAGGSSPSPGETGMGAAVGTHSSAFAPGNSARRMFSSLPLRSLD